LDENFATRKNDDTSDSDCYTLSEFLFLSAACTF